ncbi:bifunctional aspartokinase/homoserine dehydrogenase 1, chloroplastic-like [Cicer arietinum]|uniref:Bifunctional aspartokinase/homoserine dehydrogenase 1, chloroplastic-like n=1 Tax=Cicer arietinum TaxID=3827 RepID=A0A3Q7Y0C3_CICAR|nr:bifunctional aspartokinase/homoserine dehydrogenase 1, chloroplastic-like [Cicer arietinum]
MHNKVAVILNCSILDAVGQKMASTPGVSATLFNALAKAVHSRFYLSRTTIEMGIIGPGLIGSTLLDQLRDQVYEECMIIKMGAH